MKPSAYRKMMDKIQVSESKRQETADLLSAYKETEVPQEEKEVSLSKWVSKPYLRRYAAAAACIAVVITGVIIGIPKSSIPASKNNSETESSTTEADSKQNEPDTTLPSETTTKENAPTSALEPTAALRKYHLSMEPTLPKTFSFKDTAAKESLMASNPLDASFVQAVRNFSWSTSSKLVSTSEPENICYSPASVYMALALAGTGARGKTQQEFYSLLGVKDRTYLSQQCGNLYRRLYFSNEVGTMKMANSLWMSQDHQFEDSYVQNAVNNFYSSIYNVDFRNDAVAGKISKWISKNTEGLLQPKIITSPDELLSIVNTLYFKDEWVDGFDPEKEEKSLFTMANGQNKEWKFMNGMKDAQFFKGSGFITAALNMKNVGKMVFVLPDEGVKAEDLISTPEKTASLFDLSKAEDRKVRFSIPEISMGKSEIELRPILESLGLKSVFTRAADLSGISKTSSCFDHVQHGAHIKIYGKGVTAAAYTEIGLKNTSCRTPYMTLNRPFIYAVFSNDGVPLFIGICQEPVNE